MRHQRRLARLEEHARQQRRTLSHFIPVARYPWQGDGPAADWLAALVCPCGQRACPQLSIGALLPDKAPSPEAWDEEVRQAQERTRHDLSKTS